MPDFLPTSYVNYSDRQDVTALLLPGDRVAESRSSSNSEVIAQRSLQLLEAALTSLEPFAAHIVVAVHPLELAAAEAHCRELPLTAEVKWIAIGVGLPQQEILIRLLPSVTSRFVVVHERSHPEVSAEDFERLLHAGHRMPAAAFYSMPDHAPAPIAVDTGSGTPPLWRSLTVQPPYFFRSELLGRACRWSAHLGKAAEGVVSMMRRTGCRVHLLESTSKPTARIER